MNAAPRRACSAALALALSLAGAAHGGDYLKRAEVREFISEMVARHGFVRRELRQVFASARFQPAIVQAMTLPPETTRSWRGYRSIFVSATRIEDGIRFGRRHAEVLSRAEREFGVPSPLIVAILGVETVYGRNTGSWRVIDALATLAFDHPRRAGYFRSELEHFLLYARESGIDVLSQRGSTAGAVGMAQFMPGSYRRFAIDYDGDGRRDLERSAADAIGSIANFLRTHGWRAGAPAALEASVAGDAHRALLDAGVKPQHRCADLASFGVTAPGAPPADADCALIVLATPGEPDEFRIGLHNFYVLTRYNRSGFYASAVLDLAAEIAARGETGPVATDPPFRPSQEGR